MEKVVGTKEYNWLETNPKIVVASKLICRLMDDVTTREVWFTFYNLILFEIELIC